MLDLKLIYWIESHNQQYVVQCYRFFIVYLCIKILEECIVDRFVFFQIVTKSFLK